MSTFTQVCLSMACMVYMVNVIYLFLKLFGPDKR
jgi:hypothetical protein